MKECVLYKKESDGKVRCLACTHKCIISRGKTGICGVRENCDGKLFLLVYGLPVSQAVDPIEKKPLYHFLPGTFTYSFGTVGCNFRCGFCQNYEISQIKEVFGKYSTPKMIIENAIKNNCKSISYTYNEPVIFAEFVKDTAIEAHKYKLKNVMVTNGYMSKECLEFLTKPKKLIDAMNIDLKSFSENFYIKNCGAKLKPVLETINLAHKKKIHIEITTLLIPGENDSEKEIEKIARFIASVDKNIPWHISRFFPKYKMMDKKFTELSSLKKAEEIGRKYLKYVYIGNV